MDYTQEELNEMVDKHALWLDNKPGGVRFDVTGKDLTGASLVNAILDYARLVNARLVNARLDYARLDYARLDNAILVNARLVNARLVNARLDYAILDYARLDNARLVNARLVNARLVNARLGGVNGREKNTILSVSGIGSRNATTIYWVEENKIWCGCFTGTLKEFEQKAKETHGNNVHGKNYKLAIEYFKSVAKNNGES